MRGYPNVPVNLSAKKQLVALMYKVGVNRVRFDSDHLDDIADAITRENIRSLFSANTIKITPITGASRGRAKVKKIQKKKRGIKQGSKKGRKGARVGKKEVYVIKVRALRYRLKLPKIGKKLQTKSFGNFTRKLMETLLGILHI